MATELRLRLQADLAADMPPQRLVSVAVGPTGELLALLADEADAAVLHGRDVQPGWASFPHSQTRQPATATLLIHDGTDAQRLTIPSLSVAFPHVQALPGGDILVVGARAFATDGRRVLFFGGYDPNRFRCLLGRLGATAIEDLQEMTLVLPDGRPVEDGDVMGRGPLLHVVDGTGWYQIDIGDIP